LNLLPPEEAGIVAIGSRLDLHSGNAAHEKNRHLGPLTCLGWPRQGAIFEGLKMNSKHETPPTVTAMIGGRPLRYAYAILFDRLPFVVLSDLLSVARFGFLAKRSQAAKLNKNWNSKFMRRVEINGRAEIVVSAQLAASLLASQAVSGRIAQDVCDEFGTELGRIIDIAFQLKSAAVPHAGSAK
jgi:hypothetical protein